MNPDDELHQRVVRHALARGYLRPEQLRECLLIQQRLRESGQPANLLGILRAHALRPEHLPELVAVYQAALGSATGEESDLPPPRALPKQLLRESQEALRRPPSADPVAVQDFLRASGDSTWRDPRQAEPKDVAAPLAPLGRLGDYLLIRELGRGAFGIVYHAHSTQLDRPVALKVLRDSTLATPEEIERFQAEARAAARLRHPNIVGVHHVGHNEGRRYLVLDYVEGESLSACLAREGALPEKDAVRLAQQLCHALDYAHRNQILHRDLKPDNVLLDAEGVPLLADFGLAKDVRSGPGLTATGDVVGTPAYMSPEQALGQSDRIDARADLYSLGVTLFEMLTGQRPFSGTTALAVMRAAVEDEPPALRGLRPGLSRDAETLCLKCLEKDPANRYESAAALGEDLRRLLAGEPISARPLSLLGRLGRSARRRPGLALGGIALGLTLLLAGAARIAWNAALDQERREQAARARQETRNQVGALLDELRDDSSRTSEELSAAHYELIRRTEPEALRVMIERLDLASQALQEVVRASYAPALEHAAGDSELDGLKDAVDALATRGGGAELSETKRGVLKRAAEFLEAQAAKGAGSAGMIRQPRLRLLIASRQAAHPGQLAVAKVLCGVFGQLTIPEQDRAAVVECLGRYLSAERDPARAALGGQALARLGGARAKTLLGWARKNYGGERGVFWRQVKRSVNALEIEVSSVEKSPHLAEARAALERNEVQAAKQAATKALSSGEAPERALSLRARARFMERDYEGARQDCVRALKLAPDQGEARQYLVRIELELGNLTAARREVAEGLRLNPRAQALLLLEAELEVQARRWTPALAAVERALEVNPNDELSWIARGRVSQARADYQGARRHYERARELDPNSSLAARSLATALWGLGDREQALAEADVALELARGDPREERRGFLARARFLIERGDFDGAARDAEEALRLVPSDPAPALALRGMIHGHRGDLTQAVADLDRAIKGSGGSRHFAAACLNRGLYRLHAGDVPAALIDFEDALRRDPSLGHAWAQRATLRMAQGDSKGARSDLKEALEVSPRDPHVWLAKGLIEGAEGDPKRALKSFDQGLEYDPGLLALLTRRALLRAQTGDFKRALVDYEAALSLAPHDVGVLLARAELHRQRGDAKAAVADYDTACRLAPRSMPALLGRARARRELGQARAALSDLDLAVKLFKEDPIPLLERAELRQSLGLAGVLEDLEAVSRLDPRDPQAWSRKGLLEAGLDKTERGLRSLAHALRLSGGRDPRIWIARASVYLKAGVPEAAAADYRRALQLVPEGPVADYARQQLRRIR